MAKIHYDELTVGVPSKASSVNYENADGTKESVQSKISKILQTEEDTQDDIDGIKQNIADLQKEVLIKRNYEFTHHAAPNSDGVYHDIDAIEGYTPFYVSAQQKSNEYVVVNYCDFNNEEKTQIIMLYQNRSSQYQNNVKFEVTVIYIKNS